jgi:hypothetical protein
MSDTSHSRELGGGLRLRSVADAADVERVAAFDALIHGEGTAPTWRAWMAEHPHARPEGWLLVEEIATGRVVASLCLLPWRLRLAGVELRSAEMGVVGTLEEYRGRGLQRALNARFDELLREGGFDLSHIQGIPYFYRQFGYEYALPLEAWWRLELYMAPEAAPAPGYSCRRAELADVPTLARLYDRAAEALDLVALRDEAAWRYMLGPGLDTETGAETWLVGDGAGAPAGYFRVARHGFGEGLIVAEASLLAPGAALAALAQIRQIAHEWRKPYLRLNLPADTPLVTAARGLGGYDGRAYAWQVRLPNPAGLLRKLAPVFERRLAASAYAGHTGDFVISLYRQAIALRFEGGRLASVMPPGPEAGPDLRLPPPLLAPLILGHRGVDEMAHMYPDAIVAGSARALAEILFPRLRAWLYQQY